MIVKLTILTILIIVIIILIEFAITKYTKNFYNYEDKITYKTINKKLNMKIDNVVEEKYVAKNILQTFKNNNLPEYIKDNLTNLNPGWEYHFYDDEQVKKFLKEEYSDFVLNKFNSFSRGAHKADLFRLCWLYKNGGVYVDIDAECFEPFDNLINNMEGDLFTMPITYARYDRKRLLNCFIIANKGNPLVKECIDNILKIEDKDLKNVYHLVLFTMQYTLKNKIKYHFVEKNDKESFLSILDGNEWHIYDKKNKVVANSRYKNYDRHVGFR